MTKRKRDPKSSEATVYQRQLLRLFARELIESACLSVSNAMVSHVDHYTEEEMATEDYAHMREIIIWKFKAAWTFALDDLDEMAGFAEADARAEQLSLQPELADRPGLVPPPVGK